MSGILAFSFYLFILAMCFIVITMNDIYITNTKKIKSIYSEKINVLKEHDYYEDLVGIGVGIFIICIFTSAFIFYFATLPSNKKIMKIHN